MTVNLTEEEKCIVLMLLRVERRTNLNNRSQSKNPDKDPVYLYKAAVIDTLLDKFK